MQRRCGSGHGPIKTGLALFGAMAVLGGLALAGCSQSSGRRADWSSERRTGVAASPRVVTWDQPVPRGGGGAKVGPPYQVAGRWYVPRAEPGYDRDGTASWYGTDFHGRRTANGEIFDMAALSAAHPTLPLPSYVTVTNLANGRTLLVRVNDRGPFVHGRLIDMSRRSAEFLGFASQGTASVRVRYAGPAPIDGNTAREDAYLRQQPWYGQMAAASPAPLAAGRTWPGGVRPSGLGGDVQVRNDFGEAVPPKPVARPAWHTDVFDGR